ncbi:MAG: CopG family transcriptional regulator [bacterium]|nr:CopG family transcriptional regulator [bacterium]
MMINVTMRVEADLAREAKVLAARRGTSLSRLMAEQLDELVRRDRDYEAAKQRALARLETGFDLGWTPPGNREELYER